MKICLTLMLVALVSGCASIGDPADRSLSTCLLPEYDKYAYIAIDEPESGQTVTSPIELLGCSRTYESNVVYQLVTYDRQLLAMGFTNGGGVDGSREYEAIIEFEVDKPTLAYLRVYETNPADISEQKFLIPKNRITLFLMPKNSN